MDFLVFGALILASIFYHVLERKKIKKHLLFVLQQTAVWRPFRDLVRTSVCRCLLVALWLPLRSLWAPFGSLWALFGSLSVIYSLHLAPFGSLWLPSGILSLPFGSHLASFGLPSAPFYRSFASMGGFFDDTWNINIFEVPV